MANYYIALSGCQHQETPRQETRYSLPNTSTAELQRWFGLCLGLMGTDVLTAWNLHGLQCCAVHHHGSQASAASSS